MPKKRKRNAGLGNQRKRYWRTQPTIERVIGKTVEINNGIITTETTETTVNKDKNSEKVNSNLVNNDILDSPSTVENSDVRNVVASDDRRQKKHFSKQNLLSRRWCVFELFVNNHHSKNG